MSSRFDRKGTRLLCSDVGSPLVCYDLPALQRPRPTGNVQFTAEGYEMNGTNFPKSPCCFAGIEDEFVVGASDVDGNDSIYVWSAPNGEGQQSNNTPLQMLCGHYDIIRSVRYNVQNDILASCDNEGYVKLWSPNPFW